ncbi:MAG: DUF2330 domain-containing protein [Myxococcota bacterium]|nr:DUF2330 domain-containing protein [Myxococcota bacterium]
MKRWLLALGGLLMGGHGLADPCGMVPPIAIFDADKDDAIARTGIQRTYVMHKDGIETMVLHPEFRGKIDDFGMLIPFPTPPELRKVDDNIFAHLEAAIAPPTIRLKHYEAMIGIQDFAALSAEGMGGGGLGRLAGKRGLGAKEIRVREEAIGMYQVAVIEAGSAKALKKWMTENQYRFPTGMEAVAQEYVEDQWCFVAIKTNIGQKPNITAKAGMRSVDASLQDGASFDGYVQGMGFRFPSKEPVIPMRLSVFNGRDPQNVIYLLSDTPMRGQNINDDYIDAHISGQELYQNLTQPLKVVFDEDLVKERTPEQNQQIKEKSNPDPYLKQARILIGTDLKAIQSKTLRLEVETREKDLLAISESLSLRGESINAAHQSILDEEQQSLSNSALKDLQKMTLTVFSGVLPNDLIQNENLRFTQTETLKKNSQRTDPLIPAAIVGTAYGKAPFSFHGSPYTHTPLMFTPLSRRAGAVTLQNLTVGSGMEASLVQKVLQKNINQIRYCYHRVLRTNPNIAGKASFQFFIAKDGRVSTSTLKSSTVGNQEIEQCLVKRFQRYRFPVPKNKKPVEVNLSFLFKP